MVRNKGRAGAIQGRRYLFTGGGTAGHVLPNLAICNEIQRREPGASFFYLGDRKGYEQRVGESGLHFSAISCARFESPRHLLHFFLMALKILAGILQAGFALLRIRPDVVVATGGYVSVPVVLAAWLCRKRIYLHESNVKPGKANRLLALFATRIGVSFKESQKYFPEGKSRHVGYPVRREILEGSKERGRKEFAVKKNSRVALIFGGSMGSRSINRGLVDALTPLLQEKNVSVIHVSGLAQGGGYNAYEDTLTRLKERSLGDDVPGRYVLKPFLHRIQDAYAVADLVVARAGAGTVMELAAVGKPSILIPKSDAPDNHQMINALSFQNQGASELLLEELCEENGRTLTRVHGDALAHKIKEMLTDRKSLTRMGQLARELVVEDALAANARMVQRLAAKAHLLESVTARDSVGFLLDREGTSHELLFRSNVLGTGILADIQLKGARAPARAIILRARGMGTSHFEIFPRKGHIEINGKRVSGRIPLEPEDRLSLEGERFTFIVQEREIARVVHSGGLLSKVLFTGAGTLTSRFLGFLREAITAAALGLTNATDILAVGLTVSNFFRGIFAEMAVDTAFLPTFVHLERTGRQRAANRLFSSILCLAFLSSAIVAGAMMLTLPAWLPFVAPGFVARGIMNQAVSLTRIMFPYMVLISVAALLSAVLRAFNRFGVPAFSSIMFNVGVLGGLAFYPWAGLTALGIGVLAGGLGQVLFLLPALFSPEIRKGHRLRFKPRIHWKDPGVRKVGRVGPNILADVTIQKFGSVVDKILATPMAVGSVGALYFSMVIFRLPYGLISQSINTVILKEVSEGQATRDKEWTRRLLAGGLNWTLFALLPVTITLLILAEPLVRLIFEYASFSPRQTLIVASALRFYALGLIGWGLTGLVGRFFSARLEQGRATLTSLVALILNIAVSITLVQAGMGIAGLCLGTSIAFAACGIMRLCLLNKSLKAEGVGLRPSDVLPSLKQTVLCSAGFAVGLSVVHAAVKNFTGLPLILNRLFVLGVPLLFGLLSFLAAAMMVRSEQLEDLLIRLRRGSDRNGAKETGQTPVNPYCLRPAALLDWVESHSSICDRYSLAGRVRIFLRSPDWKVRNVAVKLVGVLKLHTFREDLCALIGCREPAPLGQRLLGGDFREPGFVRRNAIQSLAKLKYCDNRVERALIKALKDPYYEVRAQGALALGAFADRLQERDLAVEKVIRVTRDRNFEAARDAVLALAALARDERAMPHLKALHYHRNWQVREGVVLAYRRLFERGVVRDRSRLLALLDDVLATAEGFRPTFPLKDHLHKLQEDLLASDQRGETAP